MLLLLLLVFLPQVPSRHSGNFMQYLGGSPAKEGEVPFLVAVLARSDAAATPCAGSLESKVVSYVCAGTILSPRWVLSLASCYTEEIIPALEIEAGVTVLRKKQRHRQCAAVVHFINYDMYLQRRKDGEGKSEPVDLALLRFEPLVFYDMVRRAYLPYYPQPFGEGTAAICGWSNTKKGGPPKRLECATADVIKIKECINFFSSRTSTINNKDLCANMTTSSAVFSRFNLGAPLHDKGELVGVLSEAAHEKRKAPMAVFIDISYHIEFIKHAVEDVNRYMIFC